MGFMLGSSWYRLKSPFRTSRFCLESLICDLSPPHQVNPYLIKFFYRNVIRTMKEVIYTMQFDSFGTSTRTSSI